MIHTRAVRSMLALDDTKPIRRTVVFPIPFMLSNDLQPAVATLNSIFLGRLIGAGVLTAASSFFPIIFFLISFFIGIGSGGSALIGEAKGAGGLAFPLLFAYLSHTTFICGNVDSSS